MNEPVEQSSSIRCSCGSGSKQSIERRKAIKATNKHPHKQQLLHTHTHKDIFSEYISICSVQFKAIRMNKTLVEFIMWKICIKGDDIE